MRRTLIIASAVVILAGAGAWAYFHFFAQTAAIIVAQGGALPIAGQGTLPTRSVASTTAETSAPTAVSARLVRISAGPVVPGMIVTRSSSGQASSSPETVVKYIEQQSGNIFSYRTTSGTIVRTNNKTVPGIRSAAWLPDGSSAVVQYLSGPDLSTINTYTLSAESASGAADNGFFLPQNLSGVAVSATAILTLASGVNGSTASLRRTDGSPSSALFSTPISSLRVSFAGKSGYLAFTKPAATLPGAAFLVDSKGSFSRIAGPQSGLVALASPSGKLALVSYVQSDSLRMALVDIATMESTPLPVATIADKCVWTADDSAIFCGIPVNPPAAYAYPDDWYQGAVSFSDRIWKIDVPGRYAQLVLDFTKETGGSLDATALTADPDATELVFINKNDGALWGYQL